MHTATVSKWGNSQGVRLPSEVLRQKNISVGDEVYIDTSQPDKIIITVPKTDGKQLKAAGILSRYAKGKPDLNAERKAIEEAVVGKYGRRSK